MVAQWHMSTHTPLSTLLHGPFGFVRQRGFGQRGSRFGRSWQRSEFPAVFRLTSAHDLLDLLPRRRGKINTVNTASIRRLTWKWR
jgi:hypothetical protein